MKKFFSAVLTAAIMLGSFYFGCGHCSAQEDTSRIPIAMALDNNFALPTIVTMTSLLENKSDTTEYEFYMLLSGDFLDSNKQKLTSLTERYNCKINLIDMADHYSENRIDGHITTATYYRLQLPHILKDERKCLYLDGDTIVTGDLSEMYNVDMEDYYLAGVKDWAICAKGKSHADFLRISTMDDYVNAGVLVMNLQKMREDNLMQKFDDFMPIINNAGSRQVHHDQDILNAVCFGKIYHFPLRYNARTARTDFSMKDYVSNKAINQIHTEEEWIEAGTAPVIIHYTWKKPWHILDKKFADKWWQYAYKSGFIHEIKERYQPDYKGIPFINESFESDEITTIPIAMATDKNYVLPTVVTMTSMLENAHPSTRYEFYILISDDLTSEDVKRLKDLASYYGNVSVSCINVGKAYSDVSVRRKSHLTTASYYRCLLSELLPQIDKILYLDSDIISLKDLSKLYNTNIDNHYIAGVRGYNSEWVNDYAKGLGFKSYAEVINVPSMDQYINTGVTLMNLKLMRETGLKDKINYFIEKYHSKERLGLFHDQDALNYACYNKICFLPLRYNVMQHYVNKSGKENALKETYAAKDLQEAYENPTIIHYSSNKKPWKKGYTGISRAREWWEYAKKTPYYEEILANSKKNKKENQPIVEARADKTSDKTSTNIPPLESLMKSTAEILADKTSDKTSTNIPPQESLMKSTAEILADKTSDKTSTNIPPQESSVQQTRKIPQKYKRFVFRKVLQH